MAARARPSRGHRARHRSHLRRPCRRRPDRRRSRRLAAAGLVDGCGPAARRAGVPRRRPRRLSRPRPGDPGRGVQRLAYRATGATRRGDGPAAAGAGGIRCRRHGRRRAAADPAARAGGPADRPQRVGARRGADGGAAPAVRPAPRAAGRRRRPAGRPVGRRPCRRRPGIRRRRGRTLPQRPARPRHRWWPRSTASR